jgi:hypothetical protein
MQKIKHMDKKTTQLGLPLAAPEVMHIWRPIELLGTMVKLFVSFYDFSIGLWNCSDSVECFDFIGLFLSTIFLLDYGTVQTVWNVLILLIQCIFCFSFLSET